MLVPHKVTAIGMRGVLLKGEIIAEKAARSMNRDSTKILCSAANKLVCSVTRKNKFCRYEERKKRDAAQISATPPIR